MNNNELVRDESLDVQQAVAQRQQQTQTLNGYSHGDYIPGENGEPGGIVIDHEEVMRQETTSPQVEHIMEYIAKQDAQIAAIREHGTLDYNETMKNTEVAEKNIVARSVPTAPEMADIKKVSDMFATVEVTHTGLAPAGSKEAEEFKERMNAWEQGKVTEADVQRAQEAPAPVEQPVEPVEPEPAYQPIQPAMNVDADAKVVQFNVDSKNADTFLTTLSPEVRQKVERADTIIVNEIKNLQIPTATRTITSLSEFKKVLPKQSHSGVVETVNVNSGYAVTLKGCGALALASIIPDEDPTKIDYHKRYQFCYENLVTTSIGKLSFTEFCARTHANDLSNMLFNILRASDPDENMISLECADCHNSYDVKYRLSELLDVDSISDEMNERIGRIMDNRAILENAKMVHQESSVMNTKYVKIEQDDQTVVLELKAPNGLTIIELYPKLPQMIQDYSRFVAGILPYIHKVILTCAVDVSGKMETFEIVDIDAIAEIVRGLPKTAIQGIGKILEGIPEYAAPRYSFKGQFRCPKCGRVDTKVACNVDDLIFYRVEQAIR